MKVVKSIGLFFALAIIFFCIGFFLGSLFQQVTERKEENEQKDSVIQEKPQEVLNERMETTVEDREGFLEASSLDGRLTKNTEYVVEERDVVRGTVVETVSRLPEKYIGMNLEQFTETLDIYAMAPPLSERERGFQGLRLLSFSGDRVVVQMDYRYVQPGSGFYLTVRNQELVVLLEDKTTIYIATGIMMDQFTEDMQEQLVDMIFIENEAELYDMLEAYSS